MCFECFQSKLIFSKMIFRTPSTCFWATLLWMRQTDLLLCVCRRTGSSSQSVAPDPLLLNPTLNLILNPLLIPSTQRGPFSHPSFSWQLPIIMLVAFSMCIVCLLMAGELCVPSPCLAELLAVRMKPIISAGYFYDSVVSCLFNGKLGYSNCKANSNPNR